MTDFLTYDFIRQTAWGIIGACFLTVYFWRSDLTHFTWWSLLWFILYCGSGVVLQEQSFFWLFITIESIVIGGVMLMSLLQCHLFKTTEEDVGESVYYFGNFGMHYLPLLIAYGLTNLGQNTLWNTDFEKDITDILTAFGISLLYFSMFDPSDVYACDVSYRWMLVGTSAVVACIGLFRYGVNKFFNV